MSYLRTLVMVTPYSISEFSKDLCVLSSYIEEPRMCYTQLSDPVQKIGKYRRRTAGPSIVLSCESKKIRRNRKL